MNKEEFVKYIKSIGFKTMGYNYYQYKEFRINIYSYDPADYDFWNDDEWINIKSLNDLTIFDKYCKKEIRSNKLKKILE